MNVYLFKRIFNRIWYFPAREKYTTRTRPSLWRCHGPRSSSSMRAERHLLAPSGTDVRNKQRSEDNSPKMEWFHFYSNCLSFYPHIHMFIGSSLVFIWHFSHRASVEFPPVFVSLFIFSHFLVGMFKRHLRIWSFN